MGLLLLSSDNVVTCEGFTFDAGAGTDCALEIYRLADAKFFGIGRIFFDDPINLSTRIVNHPTRVYEAHIDNWGDITKSIPVPSGMAEASRAKVRLIDTGNEYRDRFGQETPQGKRFEVRLIQEGASESAADIIFSGVIENFEKGAGYLEIDAVGNLLSWLDLPTPNVITQTNFPEFPDVKPAWLPIINGIVASKAVPTGFSSGAPAPPADGAITSAADQATALAAEIDAITFATGVFAVFFIEIEFNAIRTRYENGITVLMNEYDLQRVSNTLTLSDAEYAQGALNTLLASTDAKMDEFAAKGAAYAALVANFRATVTAFYGEDWANLLARVAADIARLGASPAEEIVARQGRIQLPHIGFNEAIGDRWGGAQHRLWEVLCIYRAAPNEDLYEPVEPVEYSVVVEGREFTEIPGEIFNCTFIDFLVEQPEGTKIRMDCAGAYERPAFGALPAAGYPYDGIPGPLQNPIDCLLILKMCMWPKSGDASLWDVTALALLREKFRLGGETMPPLFMNSATVESMTARERCARWTASFQAQLFDSNRGLYKIVRVDESDDARPVFTTHEIEHHSFIESPVRETINRFNANYSADYTKNGEWFEVALADNQRDQDARGKIQDQTILLWDVGDAATAIAASRDRLRYTGLRSMVPQFSVWLPDCSASLELSKQIGITHPDGSQVRGYRNREVQITRTSINLKTLRTAFTTIVRVPIEFGQLVSTAFSFDAGAPMTMEGEPVRYRPTAFTNNTGGIFRGFFTDLANAFDGDPETYCEETITGTRGSTTYGKAHFHTFQPFSTAGLVSVDICVDAEFLVRGNTMPTGLLIPIHLFDGIDDNEIHENPEATGRITPFGGIPSPSPYEGGLFTVDQPRALFTLNIPAATFLAMVNPAVRVTMWGSTFQDFVFPYPARRIRDIYFNPHYS